MASFENVLRAVIGFLNDAQSLGIIKSFTFTPNDDVNYCEIPGASDALSQFFKNINIPEPIPTKNSSSDDEYIVIDDERNAESESPSESPTKENSEEQTQASEVSPQSCSSSVTEQVNEDERMPENISISDTLDKTLSENNLEHSKTSEEKEDPFDLPMKKNLVQINVDTNEMKRRISAFICRKRKEVDEWNIQEFCGRSYIDEQDPAWENSDSCARVDAVFVPRRGCKSHIKVSRVQNVWGPQTHWHPEAKKIKQEPNETENTPNEATFQAIDERLLNMETHLKLKSDSTLRTNIFKRLRDLEDRILLLESTSPEYVHLLNPELSSPKRKKSSEEKIYSNCSVEDIQKRIQTLRESLKAKSTHIKSELNFNV